MNCTEMRPFWVRWSSGNIEIGQGNLVGYNGVVSWQDPDPMGVDILR